MNEEARRVCRRARYLGFKAETLGQATDDHWDALRTLLDAEDVSTRVLCDAVDMCIVAEMKEADRALPVRR